MSTQGSAKNAPSQPSEGSVSKSSRRDFMGGEAAAAYLQETQLPEVNSWCHSNLQAQTGKRKRILPGWPPAK
jgi:hypothetical protein